MYHANPDLHPQDLVQAEGLYLQFLTFLLVNPNQADDPHLLLLSLTMEHIFHQDKAALERDLNPQGIWTQVKDILQGIIAPVEDHLLRIVME